MRVLFRCGLCGFLTGCWLLVGTTLSAQVLTSASEDNAVARESKSSVASDTTKRDTSEVAPLFTDLIKYASSDSTRFDLVNKKVFLYGSAKVSYVTTELEADFIELDLDKKEAFASGVQDSLGKMKGEPHFKDGGQEFDCKELRYNFQSGKGVVRSIIMEEGEGYIQGTKTKRMNDSVYCVEDGWYTTCDHHDHPHFYIHMQKAKMIRDEKVLFGPANLVIEDVPTPLMIPFGFFPFTQKGTSGVLLPTYGEEQIRGFNLRGGGYYFKFGEYADLTIDGDIYSNGSWAIGLSSSYKKRYKFSGSVAFTISKNYQSEYGLPDYNESQDWSVKWTHSQDAKANPYQTFSASVDMSSANNNYYNATSINDIANQRKQSSITWSRKWPERPFSVNASFNHSQNSKDTTISLTLPNFNFTMSSIYPFRQKSRVGAMKWYENIGITYSASGKNSINTKESLLLKSKITEDWTNGFKHGFPLSLSLKLADNLTFSPSMNYNGVVHFRKVEKYWKVDTSYAAGGFVETRRIPGLYYTHAFNVSASLGYTPTIYGMYLFTDPESRVSAIRHVIRPSVSASFTPKLGGDPDKNYAFYTVPGDTVAHRYNPYEESLFQPPTGATKHSGSVSLSIDNNVEMKVRASKSSGEENEEEKGDEKEEEEFTKVKIIESFKLSTSYNPFADSIRFSTISMNFRTSIGGTPVNLSGSIDPYALDDKGRKINRYAGGLGRLTSISASTGYTFGNKEKGKGKGEKSSGRGNQGSGEEETPPADSLAASEQPLRMTHEGPFDQYSKFTFPWSLKLDYTFSYSKSGAAKANIRQNLSISGNFSLTDKWAFNFSSGLDLTTFEVASTSFGITRDLHCWQMSITCIPFGTHQSYSFKINVKSSMLQDLKLTKKESWYDN